MTNNEIEDAQDIIERNTKPKRNYYPKYVNKYTTPKKRREAFDNLMY